MRETVYENWLNKLEIILRFEMIELGELEEQLQRVMSGPRSVSAEHEYLSEQIEELKRRLVDRNREYEALRRRERRLHREVFDRDERIAQLQLTMQDIEAGLSDRTAELKSLEESHDQIIGELNVLRKSEATREVVNKAFRDSLNVVRAHEQIQQRREDAGLPTGLEPIEPEDGDALWWEVLHPHSEISMNDWGRRCVDDVILRIVWMYFRITFSSSDASSYSSVRFPVTIQSAPARALAWACSPVLIPPPTIKTNSGTAARTA